jgi:hypothetical protein
VKGLMKNAHLLRYAHPSSVRRTSEYASLLGISRALHLDIFDQPNNNWFSTNRIKTEKKDKNAEESFNHRD